MGKKLTDRAEFGASGEYSHLPFALLLEELKCGSQIGQCDWGRFDWSVLACIGENDWEGVDNIGINRDKSG